MNVEDLLDQIDDSIENAVHLPFMRGRSMVDAEQVKTVLEDIRLNLPQEIKQAQSIVADRADILADAKRQAELTLRTAQDQAKALTARDEIVKLAQAKANEILSQAQQKSKEMRKAASDYVEDLMKRADDVLTENLADLRKTRQNFKSPPRRTDG